MKNLVQMDCGTVMDTLYESEKDAPLPFFIRIRIDLHLLFCPGCAAELKNLRSAEAVMRTGFFPPSPDFEESVMKSVYEETGMGEEADVPAGFSFRGWVIIGIFLLLSLSSAFFGMNFTQIVETEGLSFLLPFGITIGIVLTCYGALFIGSHLKKLSMRFGLR